MTGQKVYEHALVLIDANNDQDTSEYESKALTIINGLQGVLYPYSMNYQPEIPLPTPLTSLADSFTSLDHYLSYTVLAHGLGAYLLMDENPSTANTLLQLYQDYLALRQRGVGNPVSGSIDIEEAGGAENWLNEFTRW